MPSLFDMFSPQDISGNQIGFGDALRQNSQGLVGLGMGMLQPRSLAHGAPVSSAWGDALQGYQQGAQADTRRNVAQAQLQHQKRQEAFQRSQAGQQQSNWERQFERSDPTKAPTEFGKISRDLGLVPGTPEYLEAAKQYYQPKTEGDWQITKTSASDHSG